jgi:uncharacterized repeat protein (TIGR01451 family)/uncharacterized repeat protein (TIGR02543 family)
MRRAGRLGRLLLALSLIGWSACSPPPSPAAEVGRRATPLFDNGGFEAGGGSLGSWTVATYLNYGIVYPPTSLADLQLHPGGVSSTYARTGPTESLPLAGLTDGPDVPHFPKFGVSSAVVNELTTEKNVNSLKQSFTTTAADVDPADGKIHTRFVLAPALQAAGHTAEEQPYFYVELRNLTRGTVLHSTFNFSNQAGIPWKTQADPYDASMDVLYTDWQLFDVAPGNVALRVGDTLEVEIYASACDRHVHFGEVYVDGFGAFIPSLSVTKTAPQIAAPGTDLTYTFLVKNDTGATAADVVVDEVLPDQTTFVTHSAPGATCTVPPVGTTGTVSCAYGWMSPAAHATFTVTVHIGGAATGKISNGNYSIRGRSISPLLGPLVETTISSGGPLTDLALTVTDGVAAVTWGSAVTYTVTVANRGPTAVTGAHVTDVVPAELSGVTWTCSATGGGSCPAAGSGSLDALVDLPAGAVATFFVHGAVVAGTGSGSLTYAAAVAPPGGVTDTVPGNNSDVDVDGIGALHALTVEKDLAESGRGTVTSSPAAIGCDDACASATADFLDGTSVALTAVARSGDTFVGWTGDCSGSANTCVVTVDAPKAATAHFHRGVTCGGAAECPAGLCVDGYCCTAACAGQCQACDLPGSEGTCAPVTGAPRGGRPACTSDGGVCAGTCDGVHADCAYPGTSAPCDPPASCADGVATLPGACDGAGACVPGTTMACTPYVCAADACGTSCATAADCAAGHYCDSGTCQPLAPDGRECADDATCLSGHCVDGYCCDAACAGQCEACDVRALQGICSPVLGAPHGARPACTSDGSTCAGACDGAERAACVYPPSTTLCRDASCRGGVARLAAYCDGAGTCPAAAEQPCAPYACRGDVCDGDCTTDGDCGPGTWCSAGICVAQLPPGARCTGDNQCASGKCVDQACSDTRFRDELGGGGGCRAAPPTGGAPSGWSPLALLLATAAGWARRRRPTPGSPRARRER